jgi:hypothetical protein
LRQKTKALIRARQRRQAAADALLRDMLRLVARALDER